MAFNKAPSNWLSGYALVSSEAKFRTADAGSNVTLTKLTDAEANASTGDIRSILWAMCYEFYEAWNDQVPANRPTKMKITKAIVANPDLTTQQETYTLTFTTDTDPDTVAAEP